MIASRGRQDVFSRQYLRLCVYQCVFFWFNLKNLRDEEVICLSDLCLNCVFSEEVCLSEPRPRSGCCFGVECGEDQNQMRWRKTQLALMPDFIEQSWGHMKLNSYLHDHARYTYLQFSRASAPTLGSLPPAPPHPMAASLSTKSLRDGHKPIRDGYNSLRHGAQISKHALHP